MAITRAQLDAAADALALALKFDRPADAVLHDYFRAHRALGARDREFVAEAVYGVLRRKRSLELAAPQAEPRRLVLAYLVRFGSLSVREISALLTAGERDWAAGIKAAGTDGAPPAVRAELPDWIFERLARAMPEAEILELARGLNQPAPLDLRANTLRSTRDEVLRELAVAGIVCEAVKNPCRKAARGAQEAAPGRTGQRAADTDTAHAELRKIVER